MATERRMTRDHLTDEYKDKIRNELRKALVYFGDWDEKRINRTIESHMSHLWISLAAVSPKTLHIDGETIIGYPLSVASKSEEFPDVVRHGETYMYEKLYVVDLMVDKDSFQYVIHTFDCYDKHGSRTGETEFENDTYQKVKIEDVDNKSFSFVVKM